MTKQNPVQSSLFQATGISSGDSKEADSCNTIPNKKYPD